MAVIALAVGHGVFDYGEFIEVAEIPLIYPHLAVHLVPRGNPAVSQSPLVKRVGAYMNLEVVVLHPVAVYLCAYGDGQRPTTILFRKLMPFLHVKVGVFAVGMQFVAASSLYSDVNPLNIALRIRYCKIEWRYSGGNGHVDVIREYGRKGIDPARLMRSASASP